ncbi:MAG: hypothetical protein UT50_C0001G0057 [Candidatus Moranbacteria bacterium GW2011_GWA2_39_41]|nr:MAG: hypothetical protein UT50_C0001G0057 [Candidatus Moranbacteria bacterium GW2011_GWA2_39_41]
MENIEQEKTLTLEDIAELIRTTQITLEAKIDSSVKKSTATLEAKIDSSVDVLAAITQKNALKLEGKIDKIETKIKEVKSDTENIKANLNKKVDKIDHNELTYRVEKLEKKFA